MHRKPSTASGVLEGATLGVTKAVKEAAGTTGNDEAEGMTGRVGEELGVSVPVAEAPAGAGVTLGVSVPVAEAPAGAGVTLGVSVPVAEAPAGAGV